MAGSSRVEQLGWLHRVTALMALAAFTGLHLWVQWPALFGREPWLERVQAHHAIELLGGWVVGFWCLHVLRAGVQQLRRRDAGERVGRFPLVSGGLFFLFLVVHLVQVWPRPDGTHATITRSYQRLWEDLGQPWILAVYVLGCGALAGFLAHAVYLGLDARLPSPLRPAWRYVAGLSGFALFVCYLQLISRFATGEPLLPNPEPTEPGPPVTADARAVIPLQSPHAANARGVGQHLP
ncbi:MAG: hypothetical protein ABW321_02680 [Polyangiales bacterium]